MRRFKVLFLAFVVLAAFASVMAASASAAVSGPTLLFLSSEPGPTVLLNNKPKEEIATKLESEVAEITGKKLTFEVTLLQTPTGVTGIYLAKFFETKLAASGEACETEGAAEKGEIEVAPKGKSEPIQVVYDNLSPLAVGEVFTVAELPIKCNAGALTVKVKGTVLGLIEPINTEVEKGSNTIKGILRCSATSGVPAETKFTNSKGEAGTTALTATVAGKSAGGCELIGATETSTIPLLPTKMVEIMG